MNRRSLFSFLAAAPLAALAAVKGFAFSTPEDLSQSRSVARIFKQARQIIDRSPMLQSQIDERLKRPVDWAEIKQYVEYVRARA